MYKDHMEPGAPLTRESFGASLSDMGCKNPNGFIDYFMSRMEQMKEKGRKQCLTSK